MTTVGSYRFGPYVVDAGSYQLFRGSEVIPLSPKIIDLLLYLAARQSALVPKDELFTALWPDVAVTDNALTQAVSELRQALGDDPSKPTYIQTVARRGYRFIAPVAAATRREPARCRRSSRSRRPSDVPLDRACSISPTSARDREFAWLSSGIAETVTNDLRAAGTHRDHRSRARGRSASAASARTCRRSAPSSSSISPSSAASSAPAIGCASPRASSMPHRVRRWPTPRRTARSSRCSSSRTGSSRSSPRRWARPDGAPRPAHAPRNGSLEAYQAFTEGRVRLESLDAALVAGAIADFERAVTLDPRYALAHVGARQRAGSGSTRCRARATSPTRRCWRAPSITSGARSSSSAIWPRRTRRSRSCWSAQAASAEALAAARRAVTLEPGYWGNQFRLAHAQWGDDRLPRARARRWSCIRTSRSRISKRRWSTSRAARSTARNPCCAKAPSSRTGRRISASAIRRRACTGCSASCGSPRATLREARDEFDREVAVGPCAAVCRRVRDERARRRRLRRPGAEGRRRGGGVVSPRPRALSRSTPGRSSASERRTPPTATGGQPTPHSRTRRAAIEALRAGGRSGEATISEAFHHAVCGRPAEAVGALHRLVDHPELPFTGWTVPIEPLFAPLRQSRGFDAVLTTIAAHAR